MSTRGSGISPGPTTSRKDLTMTLEQAKQLKYGDRIFWSDGFKAYAYKVNGQPKTWKRDPSRVEIPVKHGLYTYDRITQDHLHHYHLTPEAAITGEKERG